MRDAIDAALAGSGWSFYSYSEPRSRICISDGSRFYLISRGATPQTARKELDAALSAPRFGWLIRYPDWFETDVNL